MTIRPDNSVKAKATAGRRHTVETISQLREIRIARGLGAAEIARRVGVSRQTIHAIESGSYVPNTIVALQLARVLEVSVENLFSVNTENSSQPLDIDVELLTSRNEDHSTGELVRIGRVGARMVAVPAPRFPTFLSEADGAIATRRKTRATVRPVADPASSLRSIVVAGCDPALSVLAGELKILGIEVISAPGSSLEALTWLKKGLVHVAGTHLRDHATGEYNLPLITSLFGKQNVHVVTFAEWEQGLVVRRSNPKRIRSVADLAGEKIAIVNREKGSGARDLLDRSLRAANISPKNVPGYDRVLPTHLAAALAVANSEADCCVATTSVARCLGLDFLPLSKERFDLVMESSQVDVAGIRLLLEALSRANLRNKLAALAGYDVRRTGEMLM